MAFKFILCTILLATIAIVNADDDDDDDNIFGFGPSMMTFPTIKIPTPPPIPNFPAMPTLPHLPVLKPFKGFKPRPVFPDMGMPNFAFATAGSTVEFPTPEEIASQTPKPGGSFDGVLISSKSVGKRNEDDKVQWKGGSTVVMNENGNVTVTKIGDSPPDVVVTKVPPFPDFPPKHFKPMKPMSPFKAFKHNFKKFDFDSMKNYVPKKGENFISTSASSSSFSTNVNGLKTSGGSASAMKNDNGEVEEKKAAFLKSDPPAK